MDDTQVAKTQAAWYAWGRIDSGEYGPHMRERLDVSEFSDSYMESYKAYIEGKSGFLESIQGQWQKYVDEKSKVGFRSSSVFDRPPGNVFKIPESDESEPIYSLSDCVNWETNVRGDCGGRVWMVNGVIICENCRNRT